MPRAKNTSQLFQHNQPPRLPGSPLSESDISSLNTSTWTHKHCGLFEAVHSGDTLKVEECLKHGCLIELFDENG